MSKNTGQRLTVLSVGLLLLGLFVTSVSAATAPRRTNAEGSQLDQHSLKFYAEALECGPCTIMYWNVPYHKQTDPAWSGDYMETEHVTIGAKGCCLTSVAMAFDFHGAAVDDPGELNDCLGDYACPFYHDYAADHCSSGEVDHPGYYSFSYATLKAMFQEVPPVLKITKGTSQHWVVVNSMSGDGLSASCYKVRDPLRTSATELSYLVSLGWSPNNIHKYCPE